MFHLQTQTSRRPTTALVTGFILLLLFSCAAVSAAPAAVDKSVRWASSPLKTTTGQPLPAATRYEVWLTENGQAEYLAATVNDTTYVLRAVAGVTYQMRVRGVSALGLKSAFSEMSAPYKVSAASAAPGEPATVPELVANFGPAFPNPFNARTTFAYVVPENLSTSEPLGLEIFDVRGRRLRVFDLDRSPGAHETLWDGRDDSGSSVAAGLYLARFVCGPYIANTKVTLIP